MEKTYKSELSGAIHETAADLFELGCLDKKTFHEFEETCLARPRALSPEEIRAIRERENVSQSVFASYLNVSRKLVSAWERGERKPGGPAALLLSLVRNSGLAAIRPGK